MKVLLLSRNTTVEGMIALALEGLEGADLDTFGSIEKVGEDDYDWVFVDDTLPMYREALALAKRVGSRHTVLLSHPDNKDTDGFELVVLKPFLPDEVRRIFDLHTDTADGFADADEVSAKQKKKKKKPKVLDPDEIETIKALLEEDGVEIVSEEELTEKVLSENPPKKSKKKKNADQELLKALKKMKPRKIRKLLKGAKVKIKITFPKED